MDNVVPINPTVDLAVVDEYGFCAGWLTYVFAEHADAVKDYADAVANFIAGDANDDDILSLEDSYRKHGELEASAVDAVVNGSYMDNIVSDHMYHREGAYERREQANNEVLAAFIGDYEARDLATSKAGTMPVSFLCDKLTLRYNCTSK